MAKFSIADTALEGFKLIPRRPVSFLVWALVWGVLVAAPAATAMGLTMSRLADFMTEAQSIQAAGGGMAADAPRQAAAMELGIVSAAWPYTLWTLLVGVLLLSALYRSILEPDRRGFAYLRVGGDEFRLLATMIALFVLWLVFGVVLSTATFLAIVYTANGVASPWSGLLIALECIAAVCLAFYVPFKLSLALPATFAEKKIAIFESWRLTKGHFWHIVGLWLLTLILVIVVFVITRVILNAIGIGVFMATGGAGPLSHLFYAARGGGDLSKTLPDVLHALGPTLIVTTLLQGLAGMIINTVAQAPFAQAYAALSGRPG